ncbi:MAG: hypothetical protein CO094_08185 [Anaerolineae bacterium CG_4_9_14_3_um_filter_57_17]|nr:hypothetical protein [bacterium]NCT19627.1 hypothetical protein [bacterium]OIO87413.1 MAG: hypothetical protein AUK01_00290 [Anaerolineae bacterium CG2_30_57_67]PJB66052.1 MAG: hypothetical protein CO094_08185 [Anaerolineae bacterium CG_4_9_14_3_um_filter_57_17]
MIPPKTFWQTSLIFTFLATLAALTASVLRWNEIGVILTRSVWSVALMLYLLTLAACLFLFFWIKTPAAEKILAALELPGLQSAARRGLAGGLFAGILLLIPWLKFTYRVGEVVKKSTQDPTLTLILFYFGVWWLVLLAATALKVALKTSWAGGFAAALLTLAVFYEIYQRFQAVTPYPFSLGWSEGSRYFYASLWFSQAYYGQSFPLSSLHPTRYFLQSLPFLFPTLGLEAHRFWQFSLWVGTSAVTALALVFQRRETPDSKNSQFWRKGLLAAWFFLFFLRVGIYYHLLPMILIPVLFVSTKHPRRSLAAVIFASLWAGVSRVNWFPVPAMLAAAIYLLEGEAWQAVSGQWKKLPFSPHLLSLFSFFFFGLLAALTAQAAYIPLSGNAANAGAFASSFSSDLLWYRLWPNDLFALGIVPGILLVSAPLLVTLALATRRVALGFWRWAAIWGMLAVLFAGSLVVSVKIGGGGDLHNMDAFAALFSLVGAWVIGGRANPFYPLHPVTYPVTPWPVTAFALILPLGLLLPSLAPRENFDLKWAGQNLAQLKSAVENAPGPVLFINERQLVAFGLVNVPMSAEYEAVTLMEMAMSGNNPYLNRFYSDLRAHRFALIVAGKQNLGVKDDGAFAEENNVWNTRVAPYILCYYEPTLTLEPGQGKIQVFVPRLSPGVCP